MAEEKWKSVVPGGMAVNPGSSTRVQTGAWRDQRPVIDLSKCTHCMICWIDCPDDAFIVTETQLAGVDLDHCKGCGICAQVCPAACIAMVPEREVEGVL